MHRITRPIFAALLLATAATAMPARAEPRGYYEVVGVEADDMLKMRAGPGIGYSIIVGLPNGTEVWLYNCERSGNTSWCRVSLKAARGLKGWVSGAYLKKL
ncbi:SH3 domain-containing protein [Neotabrizicola sp. VNH66]|uniref:SH3 domain-containing protein n=1 Tax=Neotabrizicola sp. VNH66 TaxID=3400918 RepID=UPI003C0C2D8F